MEEIIYIKRKGGVVLLRAGYQYYKVRAYKCGNNYWRCANKKKLCCTGSLTVNGIFGPVQIILKFDTLEEVIDRANATEYGLAAGIFTTNLNDVLNFSKHVEAGIVWVNTYLALGPQMLFGGFKNSGIGRENGVHCVDQYLGVKTVTMALPKKL